MIVWEMRGIRDNMGGESSCCLPDGAVVVKAALAGLL